MSGKTSKLELPYPVEGESADVPRDIKALAERAETVLAGTAGQLLIVKSTGAPAAKAMSGDATLTEGGALTIGAGAVGTTKLAAKSVTTAKIDDATIGRAQLAAEGKPVTWYTPKVIATEESRTNVAYGTLTTPDEIKEVVMPANGLIAVAYQARCKSSVSEAGRVALFLGANQLLAGGLVQEVATEVSFNRIGTNPGGLLQVEGEAFGATGETISRRPGTAGAVGGLCFIQAAAGTYNISIQCKATSGSVTAKERTLRVMVFGY